MTVDAQNPGNIGRDLLFQLEQRVGHLVEFGATLGLEVGLAGIEKHLRLQHEAVADDAHVGAVAEDFAKLAEEIGAVAFQLVARDWPTPD